MAVESVELIGRRKLAETLTVVVEIRDGMVQMLSGDELEGREIGIVGQEIKSLNAAEELGKYILFRESAAEGNNIARLIEAGKQG